MLSKVFQVPYGTKDILPGEMKRRRTIENAILDVFESWGYEEVKTPGLNTQILLAVWLRIATSASLIATIICWYCVMI